jgi:signal transduction histidine kinase
LPPLAFAALAVAGAAFGLALGPVIAESGHAQPAVLYGTLGLFVGWSFIGVGLYAWSRRPQNRIGPLMTATGFLWLFSGLGASNDPTVFTLAAIFGAVYHGTAIHLLLAFPSGLLETRAARLAALAGYVVTVGGNLLGWLVVDPRTDLGCAACPENVMQVVHSPTLADVMIAVVSMLVGAVLAWVLVRLVESWRRSRGWRRRARTPLLFSGAATALLLAVSSLIRSFAQGVSEIVFVAAVGAFALVPYAFLLGLARSAVLRGGAVGELVARLTESLRRGDLRDALRRALGDPELELAYWLPESREYVDAEGRRIELPADDEQRSFAAVELDGRRVGAIVYDELIVDDPLLARTVGAAAALAMETERLDAELRARVEELRASRERIVEATYEERRRLERNLHDGAQQRLASLALTLRLARAKLGSDSPAVAELLDEAGHELELGLGELRDLARGIHPAILTDRGLDAAVASLAARTPFEVEVDARLEGRPPGRIEAAAYFVVSEALANATKHAHASRATVRATSENGQLVVEVADDGVGGADKTGGSGLRGLADRVGALGGRLDVDSPPGCGTTVRARIPYGLSTHPS